MLDIIEPFANYYNELPDNTFTCVGRSALFSFVASVILNRGTMPSIFRSSVEEFRGPLFAATCAAVASLIHGLMTPLFNKLFGDDDQNKVHRELIKNIASICLLKLSLLAVAGNVEELAARIFFIPINYLRSMPLSAVDIIEALGSPPSAGVRQWCHDWGLATAPNSSCTYFTLCV